MALAILKYLGESRGAHRFKADIGNNRYFQYRVGEGKRRYKGVGFIDKVSYESKLLSIKAPPKGGGFQTEFELSIATGLIDRKYRAIQLFSFKNRQKQSPALSEVVIVRPSIVENDKFKLPNIMLSYRTNGTPQADLEVLNTAFSIKEQKVSEAMFFNALLGAMPKLLAGMMPAISNIIPGIKKAMPIVKKVMGTAEKIIPKLEATTHTKNGDEKSEIATKLSPDTFKAILEVVQKVMDKKDNTKADAQSFYSQEFTINPAVLMQLGPILEKVLSPETIKAIGDQPIKLFKAISDSALKLNQQEIKHLENLNPGVDSDKSVEGILKQMSYANSGYSRAQVAPALLAALPALMPLLQKVISPDMIKAVGEQPIKLLKTISDSALKLDKQEAEHLERLNPGVDSDKHIENLLAQMSIPSSSEVSIPFTFSKKVEIAFTEAQTIKLGDRDKVVYSKNDKIHIPLTLKSKVKSQTIIPKAIFQLIIQDGDTMQVLFEKKYKVKSVVLNQPVADITLMSDEVKSLPVNKDLKVELSFIWKNKKTSQKYGTFKNHYICLADGYIYKRMGDSINQHFILNDVVKHRKYWHKVWEGGLSSHERWKIAFECKYYYSLNTDNPTIERLESKKQVTKDSAKGEDGSRHRRKINAKLKSGLALSLESYNSLLTEFGATPLKQGQLNALRGSDFERESGQTARVGVGFKGRKGETASLWTYPEGNLHDIVLGKVNEVSPTGQVVSLEDEEVQFPKFSSIHFIGTKSI